MQKREAYEENAHAHIQRERERERERKWIQSKILQIHLYLFVRLKWLVESLKYIFICLKTISLISCNVDRRLQLPPQLVQLSQEL